MELKKLAQEIKDLDREMRANHDFMLRALEEFSAELKEMSRSLSCYNLMRNR